MGLDFSTAAKFFFAARFVHKVRAAQSKTPDSPFSKGERAKSEYKACQILFISVNSSNCLDCGV